MALVARQIKRNVAAAFAAALRVVVVLILLTVAHTVSAQIRVQSFEVDEMDQSHITSRQKEDINGNLCALMKNFSLRAK